MLETERTFRTTVEKRSSKFWITRSYLADLLFSSHPERLIAFGRLVFASIAIVAVYLDPTHPSRNIEVTFLILAAYLAFALGSAGSSLIRPPGETSQIVTHALDISTLCILVHFTDGLQSPFFAFLTFALLTGTMRWSWRGGLATVIVLEVSLIGLSWPDLDMSMSRDSDLNVLIMRSANLLVTAAMLGYFCAYRERSQYRLAKLASWPTTTAAQLDHPPLASSLSHAGEVLGASRVVVIWQDKDEPKVRIADWNGLNCSFSILLHPLSSSFDLASIPDLKNSSEHQRSVICLSQFSSLHFQGAVFVFGARDQSVDSRLLTEIIAAHIAAELERFALANEIASTARATERIRLARDMHDTVLQNLTAANLQIKNLASLVPHEVRAKLDDVSYLLLSQQQRIRHFVEGAERLKEPSEPIMIADQVRRFSSILAKQWECQIETTIKPEDFIVDQIFCSQILLLISEATANAVRHGRAKFVDLRIEKDGTNLHLCVRDNGRGLIDTPSKPIEFEPQSLKSRVRDLGGRLTFSPRDYGIELTIALPL
ncbi:signal transduction histidine kinase [Rhodoligotrophos appendicifer]|uniref:sensor histidine kinase n=1 Tax=Rhodoligotrophos appendicifer TaxID=987056 RepID=UPI0011861F57|nr:histidine kinase [Rhodoligotrophos appendicifer]